MQEAQVQSLVGELISRMLLGIAKKKKKKITENNAIPPTNVESDTVE